MNKQILKLKNQKKSDSVKIIALVGLAGSGKSTATDYLKQKGYPSVYFGGVVMKALKDENLEITPANEKMMRTKLREDFGKDVIVNKIVTSVLELVHFGKTVKPLANTYF